MVLLYIQRIRYCTLLHIYDTVGILDTTGYIEGDIPKMLF